MRLGAARLIEKNPLILSISHVVCSLPRGRPQRAPWVRHTCALEWLRFREVLWPSPRLRLRGARTSRGHLGRSYAIRATRGQKGIKRRKGKARQEVSASGNGQSSPLCHFSLSLSSCSPCETFFPSLYSIYIRLHATNICVYIYLSLWILFRPSLNRLACSFRTLCRYDLRTRRCEQAKR